MLRIQLSKPKSPQPETARFQADRYAIRYGLITAVIIAIYNLIVQATGDGYTGRRKMSTPLILAL